MTKRAPKPTILPRERAFLVGVELFQQKSFLPLEDSLAELALWRIHLALKLSAN
jgi:hypothetical protein